MRFLEKIKTENSETQIYYILIQRTDPQLYKITKNCYEQMACKELLWQHSLCCVALSCVVFCSVFQTAWFNSSITAIHYGYQLELTSARNSVGAEEIDSSASVYSLRSSTLLRGVDISPGGRCRFVWYWWLLLAFPASFSSPCSVSMCFM